MIIFRIQFTRLKNFQSGKQYARWHCLILYFMDVLGNRLIAATKNCCTIRMCIWLKIGHCVWVFIRINLIWFICLMLGLGSIQSKLCTDCWDRENDGLMAVSLLSIKLNKLWTNPREIAALNYKCSTSHS